MSLFGALRNTAATLSVLDRSVEVVQNNVANASTPGFARQILPLYARPFEAGELLGGVKAGELQTTRNTYAEASVWQHTRTWGALDQTRASLATIESQFDVSGQAGIGASMSRLFDSFSAWSVSPASSNSRQDVLLAAGRLAASFQSTSASLSEAAAQIEGQAREGVVEVNDLVAVVAKYNAAQRGFASNDPGRDATVYNALERLAEFADVTALAEADGTFTLRLGGQVTLLMGDRQHTLSVDTFHDNPPAPAYPEGLAPIRVIDDQGKDVTFAVREGRLGALLETREQALGNVMGTGTTLGSLHQLASKFATRVNAISTAAGGPPLFTYDAAQPNSVASTIALNASISSGDLVAADATNSNGVPLALARLAHPADPADRIGDLSYSEFFGNMVGRIGRQAADATEAADIQTSVVAQARNLRSSLSGVSVDEEALHLVELQRSYESIAKMARVLDEMTETLIGLVR
jgi:flagellar hook-associated protein 1 FlgK